MSASRRVAYGPGNNRVKSIIRIPSSSTVHFTFSRGQNRRFFRNWRTILSMVIINHYDKSGHSHFPAMRLKRFDGTCLKTMYGEE